MAFVVTPSGKLVQGVTMRHPKVVLGPALASATWNFFTSGSGYVTPANVYQDGNLTTPFAPTGVVTADINGRFPAIYLDTSVNYGIQLKNQGGTVVRQYDPYRGSLAVSGTSQLQAFGLAFNPQGELTLTETTGGSGVELTINATPPGGAAIKLSGNAPGAVAITINTSATVGTAAASFAAANKPGNVSTQVSLTAAPSGGTYTGGTLTAPWPNASGQAYSVTLSTGQVILACTFTNGGTAFTCPSTAITGTPSVFINVSAGIGPVLWWPVTLDGVTYYVPLWRGDLFVPVRPPPAVIGETIVGGTSVQWNPDGTTSMPNGGTANPANWYLPTTAGIGSSYWLNITKTGGALSFSAAQGSWTNISAAGLAVNAGNGLTTQQALGTYQISPNSLGTLIAATGSIILQGNGVGPNYSGSEFFTWGGDGTASYGSGGTTNWYSPTTVGVGAGYWVNLTRSGGTAGVNYTAAQGVWTNISSGGLAIGITNHFNNLNVSGTYQLSTSASGSPVVGSGTYNLTGDGNANSNYSGSAPWNLNSNGTSTMNGVGAGNWYNPTTTSIGASYWINITRTGGTAGINFSSQGVWASLNGLTINTTNIVGNATITGTYQISSSATGSPVVASGGTISLTQNIASLLHVYSSHGSGTETIPTNATNVQIEVGGASGSGGAGSGTGCTLSSGAGGGAGGYARSQYTVSALGGVGKTFNYTVGTGGAPSDQGGTASTVTAGTVTGFTSMTGNGGGGGSNSPPGNSPGAGGTGVGGNQSNQTGGSGTNGGLSGGAHGGAGINGINCSSASGGDGGFGSGNPGKTGHDGMITFLYT